RRGAGCEAPRRRPMPAHRGGAATKQTAPRRRNPEGAWGLRPHAASLVVGDEPASLSSSLLVCDPQAPCARPGRILGPAPKAAAGGDARGPFYTRTPWGAAGRAAVPVP